MPSNVNVPPFALKVAVLLIVNVLDTLILVGAVKLELAFMVKVLLTSNVLKPLRTPAPDTIKPVPIVKVPLPDRVPAKVIGPVGLGLAPSGKLQSLDTVLAFDV